MTVQFSNLDLYNRCAVVGTKIELTASNLLDVCVNRTKRKALFFKCSSLPFQSSKVRLAIIDKKKPEFEKTLSKGKIENGKYS